MLHRCDGCRQLYLVSEFYRLCSLCGSLAQQQIEKLFEADDAVEWWRLLVEAMGGGRSEVRQRWWIG